MRLGKPALQRGIFISHIGVSAQVVAKREPLDPERISDRDQVQVVRALRR